MNALFVCTGNLCRSPMAALLFEHLASQAGVHVQSSSAGLVTEDQPAAPHAVEVMADRGLDLSGHRSRLLTPTLLDQAELVVGMARQHVREAVVLQPAVWPRAFTLKELVRRGAILGPRQPETPPARWFEEVAAQRSRNDLLGKSPLDDVLDPIGQRREAFAATADEIDESLEALVDLLWSAAVPRRAVSVEDQA